MQHPGDTLLSTKGNKYGDKSVPMDRCLIGNKVISIPQELCEQEELFNEVMSMETWETVLTGSQRRVLMNLLPKFPENDEAEKLKTLRSLFEGENFKFGNPIHQFFQKLKDGFMEPEVCRMALLLKKARFRQFQHQQRRHYFRLLKDCIISRKKLLDMASSLPPNHPLKMDHSAPRFKNTLIEDNTRWRYFTELQEIREECGEPSTSSEDENYPDGLPLKLTRKHKKQLQNMDASLSPDMTRVTSTVAPILRSHDTGSHKLLNHSLVTHAHEMTDERYHEMLLKHKQRREQGESHPDLNVSSTTLEEIIARANIAKRSLGKCDITSKKKAKANSEVAEKKPKLGLVYTEPEMSVEPTGAPPSPLPSCLLQVDHIALSPQPPSILQVHLEEEAESVDIDVVSDEEGGHSRSSSPSQHPSSFFSLMRDLFNEAQEQKMSAAKLEDKVKNWLDGSLSGFHDWVNVQEGWPDLVSSALKFLAGDLISILPENFVPYLDYKEKQQQWQWIGAGRDSNKQLSLLFQHWLENKDDTSLDALEISQGSPPPPRVVTDWAVRQTTDEEKSIYQEQERVRYQNPHKAFTFHVHGYESVVGPVKGVYGKEGSLNKAREHSLLVSERPAFVTILSLVRDAAARLPNGEGTRADICELLKDSQYLSPTNDQQIHTVVSGALDRLHYEKDPCVKYDVNRKLWIYLHRNRTEGEFERIHQAHAAAAKAKKAIQKNKLPRVQKSKEHARTTAVTSTSDANPQEIGSLNSSSSTVTPPKIPPALRPQGSPQHRQLTRSLSVPTQSSSQTGSSVASSSVSALSNSRFSEPTGCTSVIPTTTAPMVTNTSTVPVPPQVLTTNDGSQPLPQCSHQSLTTNKALITNTNAAQLMGTAQLHGGATDVISSLSSLASQNSTPTVDMKPSSPAFVGQPPVLTPMLTSTSPRVTGATLVGQKSTPSSKRPNSGTAIPTPGTLQGFQTIVIKQEPNTKATTQLTTLPMLTTTAVMAAGSKAPSAASKPVVARLVTGSQVVALDSLVGGGSMTASSKQNSAASTTFRIQGSGFVRPVTSPAPINMLQATQLTATSGKFPKLAVVTQTTTTPTSINAPSATTTQPKLISVGQGHLGILQTAALDSVVMSQDSAPSISKPSGQPGMKVMAAAAMPSHPSHTTAIAVGNMSSKSTQAIVMAPKPGSPSATMGSAVAVSTANALPGVILATSNPTSSPTVVIACQGALKPTQTYVMAAPGTTPTVVMAATQQGVRGTTVTPLNLKALQGIKVIPVSQAVNAVKGGKTQPLLARIIGPPGGITLRPAGTVPASISPSQQATPSTAVSIIQGLGITSQAAQSANQSTPKPTSLALPTTGGQPVIVQVQTSTTSSQHENTVVTKVEP